WKSDTRKTKNEMQSISDFWYHSSDFKYYSSAFWYHSSDIKVPLLINKPAVEVRYQKNEERNAKYF
ncbi:MAG: hypothetical protein DRJ15_10425, partial [Bacteroidetes bacterium]